MTIKTLFVMTISLSAAFAGNGGDGSKAGGGGDARTEGRIDEIRADILKWIDEGGAKALSFSKGMTHAEYANGMNPLLAPQAVVVTAILTEQEVLQDPELNTRVDGQPKTCKGFVSENDKMPHILCNVERFWEMSESEQYRQIHHEYAGLARLEKNIGAASDYSLSKQLTKYLMPVTVLKLAVVAGLPAEKVDTSCRIFIERGRIMYDAGEYFGRADLSPLVPLLQKKGYEVVKKKHAAIFLSNEDYRSFRTGAAFLVLRAIHPSSGFVTRFTHSTKPAIRDSRREPLRNAMTRAKTVAEYQAAKAVYDSTKFKDFPGGTVFDDFSKEFPTCDQLYGKRSLTTTP